MIRSETAERVARIRFDRADKKNAITVEMYAQLAGALAAADADPGVRALLLHGSADCFTAGNDVADFLKPAADASPTKGLFDTLPNLTKPIVAAVGGPAVGIGSTMLLHCDFVYATPEARFQLPFVPLGIVPEFGSTYLLPLLAGYQRAAELLLLGQPFTAEKARDCGLVTAVVPRDRLLEEAEKTAKALVALPPESIRLTKRLMKSRYGRLLADAMTEETRIFRERLASPEAKEAMSAFLEKRKK
ncbi:MAG TPA: enoyl-CoA hydratase [Burkholderiales bacterium]|nr:enoyl-CoA hydratase [Burkholderiales bacterium]